MRTKSNRELARHLGVSETAVRRAEKAGRIRREADGGWHVARVKAAWAGNTDAAQQRRRPGPEQESNRTRATLRPVPEAAVGAVRETLREHGEPVSAGGMTFMQARTANEVRSHNVRSLTWHYLPMHMRRPQVCAPGRVVTITAVTWRARCTTRRRSQ
jgi:hypothetical protein